MCAEEKEQITDYSEIRDYNVSEKWQSLQWKKLERKDGVTVFPPNSPGLYRLVFKTNSEIKSFPEVCICNKNDAKLKCENIFNGNEIVLSIGKTKKLKTRLTQHFGKYKIASRLKNRCIQFFKNDVNDDISKISLDNLENYNMYIEYVIVKEWWKRDLFEAYGKAIHCCLFDLEIEH